ncbi:hypothetical protein FPOAC1_001921 [Fusarium poae]|nr:hypothetical protein FPOAC1_001921 [Fusarium poae]KAG8675926.1 hypothetical protein FPOAC1_001921 [Fusarium poae]
MLSNAGSKAEGIEKQLGAEQPAEEAPKLEEPKADSIPPSSGSLVTSEPKENESTSPDSANKEKNESEGGMENKKEGTDSPVDEHPGTEAKENDEKSIDASDNDKKSDDADGKDNKDKSPNAKDAKDAKEDGADIKDATDSKDTDKSDTNGKNMGANDTTEAPPPVPTVSDPKDLGVDTFLASPADKAASFTDTDRPWEPADGYTTTAGLDKFSQSHEAYTLNEAQWIEVLENCGAMYGWCIDGPMKQIVRAPKAAFQLKTVQPPGIPLNPPTTTPAGKDSSSGSTSASSTASFSPGTLTPASSTTSHASSEQGINGVGSSTTITGGVKDAQASTTLGSMQEKSHNADSKTTPSTQVSKATIQGAKPSASSATHASLKGKTPKRVLPDFSVNDNSRINVVVSSHEFQTSMATNDFSASSTSASLGGSYGPISASVSASEESMHSSSTSNTSDTYHKTMIAKYLFPRVDLSLDECLEPTEGLTKAIQKVEATKNIKDLRQLRRDYGYLFCKTLTIGGRLQTQSIMADTEKTSEQEQKQSMKTSVGLAVSSPKASASVSHTQESGSANSQSQATSDKSESHAFEAMGGDSLLASNPVAWIPTVGNYNNWRIINRDGLILMSDMISGLSGYEHTRSWFEQAVPGLSKYIEFSDKLVKKIRLRLMSPNHNLCLSYKSGSQEEDYALPPNYYFGHRPMSTVMPIAMELVHPDVHWGAIEMPNGKAEFLFSPGSYRAPAIYGCAANKAGDNYYGTTYDDGYKSTIWSITSPYDDALCHESRVIIQTVSPGNTSTPEITGNSANNTPTVSTSASMVSSLVVFRNQQGVFLPAMSDAKDVHIWRVLKHGAAPGQKVNIAEGDQIQLAWCYQDQYCGYRDFTEDAFGRRRNGPPPEAKSSTLYMRLPWPRFEPVESISQQAKPLPNTLMMSDVSQEQDSWKPSLVENINVIKGSQQVQKDILVEDCIFRLDIVKHHGRGDVNDYLLRDVKQEAKFPDEITSEELEKQIEAEIKARKEQERQEREARAEAERHSEGIGMTVVHTLFPLTNLFS